LTRSKHRVSNCERDHVKDVKMNVHLKNGSRSCMGNELLWLMRWYAAQFDDYWERWYGIILDTRETPGWDLMICIDETALEDKIFEEMSRGGVSDPPEANQSDPPREHIKVTRPHGHLKLTRP
jgi:hypothetical protein